MNATQCEFAMQRWPVLQHDLMPELQHQCGALAPGLEKLAHLLDCVRIEGWAMPAWTGIGRQRHDRSALAKQQSLSLLNWETPGTAACGNRKKLLGL
jgi:hypothetical protein